MVCFCCRPLSVSLASVVVLPNEPRGRKPSLAKIRSTNERFGLRLPHYFFYFFFSSSSSPCVRRRGPMPIRWITGPLCSLGHSSFLDRIPSLMLGINFTPASSTDHKGDIDTDHVRADEKSAKKTRTNVEFQILQQQEKDLLSLSFFLLFTRYQSLINHVGPHLCFAACHWNCGGPTSTQ